ncbi:MAG TPA: helix-turn-helix transcriptional regulator [Candidatus Limnocylindrales bacterium]|nr:helix-turn-helix transcriptional regulator [Candidatus Limnocylindrales bacterium]
MQDAAVGAALRSMRLARELSQEALAARVGVSRGTISRLERGRLDDLTVGRLRQVSRAFEVGVDLELRGAGGRLERVRSARHSALAEATASWVGGLAGWEVRPEVSFSIWGDRGAVDLVAWHAATQSVLVVELKTLVVDIGELLGTLDRKLRLAAGIVEPLDWRPASVSAALIVGDSRSNHRRVREHARLLRAALPDDGRRLRAWLARPSGEIRALTFLPDERPTSIRSGFATPERVTRSPRRRLRAQPGSARAATGVRRADDGS